MSTNKTNYTTDEFCNFCNKTYIEELRGTEYSAEDIYLLIMDMANAISKNKELLENEDIAKAKEYLCALSVDSNYEHDFINVESYINDKNEIELREDIEHYLNEKNDKYACAKVKRTHNLYNILKALIELQPGFFKGGQSYIAKITAQDIADKANIKLRTVQNIMSETYVDTKFGTYLLKYFVCGETKKINSKFIEDYITSLILREDCQNPLKDDEIAELISKEFNINFYRVKVVNLRNKLKIASRSKRKIKKS